MKKIAFLLILSVLLSFGMSVVASAEEYGVTPRYVNCKQPNTEFWIDSDIAYATIYVIGTPNVTLRTTVNVTIEKRVLLGLWWKEEASWTSSSTDLNPSFTFTKEVKNGTYRCNFEITVEGSGGSADVITDQITAAN